MNNDERVRQCIEDGLRAFKDHKLSIQRLSDSIEVLDFRRPDSVFYAIRIVFDNQRGHRVYISGDIGEAVIYPTCDATLAGMATCFTSREEDGAIGVNWYYFIEKIKVASGIYEWNRDDFMEDFMRCCEENGVDLPDGWLDEHMDIWGCDIEVDRRNGVKIWGEAKDELESQDRDFWEWLYDCGKRVDPRVVFWLVAMRLAYEALEKGEVQG